MKQFIIQKMAVKNLTRRPVRSWSMIFFVFMLSFSLMLSTVLVDSMKDRLEKTTDRLGADIIVVPKEYERSMADSLFLGEKCDFTFDKKWDPPPRQKGRSGGRHRPPCGGAEISRGGGAVHQSGEVL